MDSSDPPMGHVLGLPKSLSSVFVMFSAYASGICNLHFSYVCYVFDGVDEDFLS